MLFVAVLVGVAAFPFRRDFPAIIIGLVVCWMLADGISEGEIAFGQRDAKRRISRSAAPVAYWSVVTFYCTPIVILALVVLKGQTRRSLSSSEQRASKTTEPTPAPAVALTLAKELTQRSLSVGLQKDENARFHVLAGRKRLDRLPR